MLYQYNKKRKELRETIKKDEEYINAIRSELTKLSGEKAKHYGDGLKMNRMQEELDRLQALKPESMDIPTYKKTLESYTKELNKATGAFVERTIIDLNEDDDYEVKILFD